MSFPTWTVLNDQDDLAADFLNTQQGTKNGNVYTFQVKASEHNNEGGYYATHIYAVDKAGNTVSLQLDPVEVKDPSLDKITLITDSQYNRSEDRLYSVRAGTAVSVFLTEFENEVIQ